MNSALGTARDVLAAVLLLAGGTFCLLGALGLLRFPDTLTRLHAAAKAQTAGLLLILLGTATQVPPAYALMLLLVALFQLVTVPVTAQIVGRAAYRSDALDHPGLVTDDLGDRLARDRKAAPSRGRDKADDEVDPDADL